MQENFAELVTALKHLKSHNKLHQTPTHLDHWSTVKIDINKISYFTSKTRYNGQIITQPKLKIKLLNTSTTTEHQVLQLTMKLDYSKMNQEVTTNNFVLYLFFFPKNESKINFSWAVGSPTVRHITTVIISTRSTKGYNEHY